MRKNPPVKILRTIPENYPLPPPEHQPVPQPNRRFKRRPKSRRPHLRFRPVYTATRWIGACINAVARFAIDAGRRADKIMCGAFRASPNISKYDKRKSIQWWVQSIQSIQSIQSSPSVLLFLSCFLFSILIIYCVKEKDRRSIQPYRRIRGRFRTSPISKSTP
jgi:hypothetical protein